jgi:transcriptional regulator with XRE-family HTH domain
MNSFRYVDFGRKIKAWRAEIKPPMTQRQLARKIGVSDGFIAHIEIGRTLPGKVTLRELARVLGISELQIFQEAGYLSNVSPFDEELIDDHELRLFFRDDWKSLSEDDKEWVKNFVRIVKEKYRNKSSQDHPKDN